MMPPQVLSEAMEALAGASAGLVEVAITLPSVPISDASGRPYFARYRLIDAPGVDVYLHHFLRPSTDRGFHNHPRSGWVQVLTGGYIELRSLAGGGTVELVHSVKSGREFRLEPKDFHRIVELPFGDTWTVSVWSGPDGKAQYHDERGRLVGERL